MEDSWYSMCVFVPTFKSMMRGEGSKQKEACITTGYEKPTKENWVSLCIGRRTDFANMFWPDDLTYAQYVYNYTAKQRNLVKQNVGGNEKNDYF